MEKGFGKKMDRSEMPRIVPQAKAGEFDAPGANDFQIVSGSPWMAARDGHRHMSNVVPN